MARRPAKQRDGAGATPNGGATTGHEAALWAMADALRGSMDAAEYKHIVLGLIFLKYISDAFEERRAAVLAQWGKDAAEDRDEYIAENVFWVPPEARWLHLKAQARQSTVGLSVDQAMAAIERDNPTLKDVLPRDYARPALDKRRLGQLIDLVSNIQVGDQDARSRDVLGRVYEYFLSQFASAEGKKGGEFYTPRCGSRRWSRCWNRTAGASTIHAAARRACSYSRSRSSAPMPAATAMAARRVATSASTAKSRTTRSGGWRR